MTKATGTIKLHFPISEAAGMTASFRYPRSPCLADRASDFSPVSVVAHETELTFLGGSFPTGIGLDRGPCRQAGWAGPGPDAARPGHLCLSYIMVDRTLQQRGGTKKENNISRGRKPAGSALKKSNLPSSPQQRMSKTAHLRQGRPQPSRGEVSAGIPNHLKTIDS